jgi:hypothetical protein
VSYKIGFDGVVSAELEKLLQSVENRVNGFGMLAQTSEMGASTVASGSAALPCPTGQTCSDSVKGPHDDSVKGPHDDSVKGPHDVVIVVVIAIVAGAAAGYVAGKRGAKRVLESVKGPHD